MTTDVDIAKLATIETYNRHNFSLGCLFSYFYLEDAFLQRKVLFNGRMLTIGLRGTKTFVFSYDNTDIKQLIRMQQKGLIYSIMPLPLTKQSSFEELVYDLDVLFNPSSYVNAKKRYQRIRYPLRWLSKVDATYEKITDSNIDEILRLHNMWVQCKWNDRKTHRYTFPTRRYMNCCYACIKQHNSVLYPHYESFVLRLDGIIEAVRVVSIQATTAYDLAFFGNTWSAPSQLMNYFDLWVLKQLHDKLNIRLFNCGASLNKYLKVFKTHYPSFSVKVFRYARLKTQVRRKNLHNLFVC